MQLIRKTKEDYRATLNAWNDYYDNKLTVADAKEISNNLFELANLLLRWKEQEEVSQELKKSA